MIIMLMITNMIMIIMIIIIMIMIAKQIILIWGDANPGPSSALAPSSKFSSVAGPGRRVFVCAKP